MSKIYVKIFNKIYKIKSTTKSLILNNNKLKFEIIKIKDT